MNFLVVGTVRNCEKKIFETIKVIDKGLTFAKRIEYFFVESDSDDKTLKSLNILLNQKSNFQFESFGRLRTHIPLRTERLAICRNRCLEYLRSKQNSWAEYLIVVDADGICSELSSYVMKDILSKDYWSVMTANVLGHYYDIYALRHKTWCPDDFYIAIKDDLKKGFSYHKSYLKNVIPKMVNIKQTAKIIEVDSAFGGLAIYRNSSIPKDASYLGVDKNGDEVCEHVSFHHSIRNNNGKIFINPRLIIGPGIIKNWIIIRCWIQIIKRTIKLIFNITTK